MAKATIGIGGAVQDVNAIHIGVNGAWKQVKEGYIGVNGAWKRFYAAGPPIGTYFSRRQATMPLPPSPAFTCTFA